jgi:hypothetical protein
MHLHRGGTINGMLVTLSILGSLTAATFYVAPQYLAAQPAVPSAVPAVYPDHQGLIEDVATLIAQSVGVLAIHPRGASPFQEMVLWLADNDAAGTDGRADESELAILSHSRILHTITIYRRDGGSISPARAARKSPEFCRRWRADPGVTALVLGRGVSDMRVDTIGDQEDQWNQSGQWGALQRLRVTLTWPDDSADGADEASVLVDTVLFPTGVEP